jgi:hypothetical protein
MKFYFPILVFCIIGFCSSKQKQKLTQPQLDSLMLKEAMHYDSLVQKSTSFKKLNDGNLKILKFSHRNDSALYLKGYEYHILFIGDSINNLKKIEIQFHNLCSLIPLKDFQDLNNFFYSNREGFDIKSNVYTIGFVTNDKQRIYLYHFENGKKVVWVIYQHRYYKRINL